VRWDDDRRLPRIPKEWLPLAPGRSGRFWREVHAKAKGRKRNLDVVRKAVEEVNRQLWRFTMSKKDTMDQMADDELAKLGITKKKTSWENNWDDEDDYARSVYAKPGKGRGTSWEPSRQPVYTPPTRFLGPKDRMDELAGEWNDHGMPSRVLDKIVTIATNELANLLRLADLEPPKHTELYLMVEAIVRASKRWSGIGTKPIRFDDE
jgi:hypothetical protein